MDPWGWDKEKPKQPQQPTSPDVTPKPPTPGLEKDSRGEWYFDIGYSGFGPSPSHPGVNVGIQIGSQGFNFYWGVGLGFGWGATATFHPSQTLPSAGTKVSVVGRIGLEGFGIKATGSVTKEGAAGRVGFGVGIGAGVSTTATHTIRIFSWSWD